ncbi:hypothetical protein [Myxosarcina sp. GI1(2024)]
MTLKELQKQALQLPISERWRLVQSLLTSIEHETQVSTFPIPEAKSIADDLHPWTQSLIGIVQIDDENFQESYVDYLEEK